MKRIIIITLTMIFCIEVRLPAQFFNEDISGMSIEEIIERGEGILEDTANPNRLRDYKHYKRWEIANLSRLGPDKSLMNASSANLKAYQALKKRLDRESRPEQRSTHGDWEAAMPTQFSSNQPHNGRINVIAVHPNNENVIFAGAAWGGLWKSTNAGGSWTCLTDGLPVNGISGIVIHPIFWNTMYILTGDGDGRNCPSVGILKSTDGGYTWYATGFQWDEDDLRYGYKLIMNPDDPNIMFAATSNGLYRTSNGWNTYTLEYFAGMRDIEFKPGNPQIVYASTWRHVLRSTDGGLSWANLSSSDPVLPYVDEEMSRVALAVSPHNPSWVYALMSWDDSPEDESFIGLYASANSGDSWTVVCDTQDILGRQTWYDLVIAVDPENVTHVLAGGVHLFDNYNVTVNDEWERIGQGWVHADLHDLLFTDSYIYAATDGGMSRSSDGGTTWVDISEGLSIAQIYDFDVWYNSVIEGSQDNGTMRWGFGDSEADHILGGDGFECMFHPTDPNIIYACHQNGRRKSDNGGVNFYNITPPGDSNMWDASWIMHPFNPDTLYSAWKTISRTYDGGVTWVDINPGFSNDRSIRAMAQGIDNPNRLYASDRWSLRRTSSLHGSAPGWVDFSAGLPFSNALLGGIAVDPDDANRVWCTFQGYGSEKVFYSSNGGFDWTDVSGSLPHVPILSIIYQPGSNDGIYVGTTIGVFYKNADLNDWIYFSNGLPVVGVEDMKIYGGRLYVATYGRGVWRSYLYTTCPVAISLSPASDPSNPLSTGVQHYSASHSILSTRQIVGGIGTDVLYQAGNYVRLDPGFEASSWSEFEAKIDGCPD